MEYRENITEFDGLDFELFFATEILKLSSLHYGFWDGEDLTLENLKNAQKRYTETLVNLFPDNVKTVLDVGAGIGDNAKCLVSKGYEVTSISPDKNHSKYFNQILRPGLKFISTKFEDLKISEKFDLILMSESHNYFEMNKGFSQSVKYLKPHGFLYVSGIFINNDDNNEDNFFGLKKSNEYIKTAEKYGFTLVKQVDITEQTLPTIKFAKINSKQYIDPFLNALAIYAKASLGWKLKILKLMFRKQTKELTNIYMLYKKRLDPDLFQARAKYLRLIFRLK